MKPLYPIMAVVVAASAGLYSPRALAADGKSVLDETGDKHPVNAMTKALETSATAKSDAGRRLESFLLDTPSGGKSFVKPEVDRAAIGAVVREWAEKTPAATVGVLYFVAGPGSTVPGWAVADPVLSKTFKSGLTLEGRLRKYLENWTDKAQIAPSQEKSAATAFLNEAATAAQKVISDVRTTRELDLSIEGNRGADNTPYVDGRGTGVRRDPLPPANYDFDVMFKSAAKWGDVYAPGEGKRTVSMQILTKRADDGSMINELGVCDITDTNAPYCRRYSMEPGTQKIMIGPEGARSYDLKIETVNGKRQVSLSRPDSKPPEPGTLSGTSIEELLLARADLAASINRVHTIGGKQFYEVPTAGGPSGLIFMPKETVDNRSLETARALKPSLYAPTTVRNKENDNVDMAGKPHLGELDGKEYHLELIDGQWEIKDGPGDKPKPKPTAPADGGSTGDNTGGNTGDNTGNTGNGATWETVQDLENLLLSQGWQRNAADMAEMDEGLKSKYRIVYRNDPVNGLEYAVLVPKNLVEGGQLVYKSILKNADGSIRRPPMMLKRVMGWKKYLVLQFDQQQQYLDLTKPDTENGFKLAGFLHKESESVAARQFVDAEPMADGLKRFAVLAAKDQPALTEIPKRAKAKAGTNEYSIEAYFTDKGLLSLMLMGGKPYQVWPNEGESGVADDKPQYAGLNGVANVFEGAVSSEDAALPDVLTLDGSGKKAEPLLKQSDVALYKSKDTPGGSPEPAKYYLMFRFKATEGTATQQFRVKPFEVFSEAKGGRPLPAKYGIAGLLEAGDVIKEKTAMGYGFVPGSSAERGVLAVYQNKQVSGDNVRKAGANCAGPILWWGSVADRDAALKACRDDKF